MCSPLPGLLITSNVYQSSFIFDREMEGFDFFKVEGISSTRDRYSLLGKVVYHLQGKERKPFATYTPSDAEIYVIGVLGRDPSLREFRVESLNVRYEGQGPLPPSPASRRSLTELLNKSKQWELEKTLWSPGAHTFYPKTWTNLNDKYPRCGLGMFRGPFFRYNVLSNGRVILTLDSSTHYVRLEPFLREVNRKGRSLEWFEKELELERKGREAQRRTFRGLHFFNVLLRHDVEIDGFDPRTISKIPLSQRVVLNGVECESVAEYLKAKYRDHPGVGRLDETQPGLRSGEYTYAPQFLHRTAPLEEVRNDILNEETFHMDTGRRRGYRDTDKPARRRWELFNGYFEQYHFDHLDLGPVTLRFTGPLEYPAENHLDKPLLLAGGGEPVEVEAIESALSEGLYQNPSISSVYLYSVLDRSYNNRFYAQLASYAKRRFLVDLPDRPLLLETDLSKAANQLEGSLKAEGAKGAFCLGLVPRDSAEHNALTNLCGKLKVPSKCVSTPVVEEVCAGNRQSLKYTLASIIARAGGIPWILHDRLNYGCYLAVDVGRSKAAWWAMSVVYDKDGKYAIQQGELMVGEDLDESSIRLSVEAAHGFAPGSDSLILLRHGEVYEGERRAFVEASEKLGYTSSAMVSIKENVPYRIFRKFNSRIAKPISGDLYFLDDVNVVLCGAGGEQYEHGTPQPMVAELIRVKGEVEVGKVVQDLFYLTFLNWGSPGRSYSLPAPIRLAHESARELSAGIQRFGAPF